MLEKFRRDFTRENRRQTQKRMRLMLGKSQWDFTRGKVKKGKNSPAFRSARKVRAGFHLGKQATNSKKVTFTVWKVPTGFRSGKQATNSKKALFGTWRVRAGLHPKCTLPEKKSRWDFAQYIWRRHMGIYRSILLYAGARLSHGTRDSFVVIQSEI